MTDDELAELLRSVISRPDDHDVLQVYADVLIERGDPRGDMIAVQLQRRVADSPELATRERELAADLDASLAHDLGQPGLACAWRRGFLDAVDFTPVGERTALNEALRKLGTLPLARQLRRIVIRFVEPGWGSLGAIVATLTKVAPQLRSLRELVFTAIPHGDEGKPQSLAYFVELSPLVRAAPKLEVLEVVASDYPTFRDVQLPALRRLVFEEPRRGGLQHLAAMQLVAVEELEVHGRVWRWNEIESFFDDARPLRHLAFTTSDRQTLQQLARNVPAAPAFANVRTLSLGGALDKTCVDYLVNHAAHLRRLKQLEIDVDTPLREQRRLRDVLGNIIVVRD